MSADRGLVCAGCGARGHPPRIVWNGSTIPPGDVTIRPTFGWRNGCVALLCDTCRVRLERRRRRRARAP